MTSSRRIFNSALHHKATLDLRRLGRPLTDEEKDLIKLLAAVAVDEFILAETSPESEPVVRDRPVMPFGKFKHVDFADLPDWYLRWLVDREHEWREPLKSYVRDEAQARGWDVDDENDITPTLPPLPDRGMAQALVDIGFRRLAMAEHPDHGGDTRRMQTVNLVAEWLRHLIDGAST